MFERFTERARQVVVLAQDEARALGHGYIGTEHLLLGILREEEGLGARVLRSLGVEVDATRAQVARIVGRGDERLTGQIPFTPHAMRALELSPREALSLGHDFIGTEHVLLGLVRANDGVAAQVLTEGGLDAERVREAVIRTIAGQPAGDVAHMDFLTDSWGPGWTGYGPTRNEIEGVVTPIPAAEPMLLRGILIGWALFGAASGIGLLVGWLIWG